MKITQDVRDYAAKKGLDEEAALAAGMKEKAEEFKKKGSEIYLQAPQASENAGIAFKAAAKE
jgi:hypothetical protein